MTSENGLRKPPARTPRLGRFEELVLMAAVNHGEDVTAGTIREMLAGIVGSRRPTTVITTIDRLIEKGCMTKSLEDAPRPTRGGRRCRVHNVTPTGLAVVGRTVSILNALAPQDVPTSDDRVA